MLIDRLEERARTTPKQVLLTWVDDNGKDEQSLSVAQLLARAETLSGFLYGPCGLRPGDRVLLVYPPSLSFVEAFIACLYAGVIPVPCYPPDPRDREQVARLGFLAKEAGARVALTNSRYRWAQRLSFVSTLVSSARPVWPDLLWHVTDDVKTGAFSARRHHSAPSDVAFLQYTSGSTSAPRGVALTFANLQHQLDLNARALRLEPTSRAVLWVPQYHDLGLVSGIASAVHGNGHLYAMSPLSFLSRPAVWAEVITRTRATHTAAPHFGYALLLRKTTPAERARFDFSCLQVMMSAGESIHAETMDRFCAAFAASGLRREAWCPAYGLAEHTVGVTIRGQQVLHCDRATLEKYGQFRPAVDAAQPHAIATLVGCGRPESDVVVRIVDPESKNALPDGSTGEIWVDSPSKADSYFGRPEDTEALLRAQLAGTSGAGARTYLRTGDLGFLHDGELFITGRLKDLIIVAGRNVSAVDVEDIVRRASPHVRPGGIAAVAVEDARSDSEAVGLLLESTNHKVDATAARAIADVAREAVLEHLRIPVSTVIVGVAGLVKKTTSGKPQRRACREALLAGTTEKQSEFRFRFDFDATPEQGVSGAQDSHVQLQGLPERLRALPIHERLDAMIAALQEAVARAIGHRDAHTINPQDSLASFGLDSMSLVELAEELSELVETALTLALVAALPNLASLASFLLRDILHIEYIDAARHGSDGEQKPSRWHKKTWQPEPTARIAVVGAGCAGLVAAMELATRGYRNVTIFEANSQVGGKVLTLEQDGVDFELGQLLFGQRYRAIWRLAIDVGCEFFSELRTDFLQEASGERSELRTTHAVKAWYETLFAAAGMNSFESPEPSVEEIPEDLLMPVGAWLAKHRIASPPAAFLTSWTACGYGYLSDEIPAWYLLRYARIIHSASALPLAIKGGNQSLWTRVARVLQDKHGFRFQLGAAVTHYETDDSGVSLAVANAKPERFDAVLFASPAHVLAPLLPVEARGPFERFRHYGYRSVALDAEGMPDHIRSIHFAEAQRVPDPGRLLAIARAHSAPRSFVACQYISRPSEGELSDAELDAKLQTELQGMGVRITARRGGARWLKYFPHLAVEDLKRGTLQEIESRQGKNRTFYTGSYLAFETLEHVARHAQALVRTFF